MQLSAFKTDASYRLQDSSFFKRNTEISFDHNIPVKNTYQSSKLRQSESIDSDFLTDEKRTSTLHFFENAMFATHSTVKAERSKPRILHQPKSVPKREPQRQNTSYYNDQSSPDPALKLLKRAKVRELTQMQMHQIRHLRQVESDFNKLRVLHSETDLLNV